VYKQIPLDISSDLGLNFDNFYQTDSVKPIVSELKKFILSTDSCTDCFLYLWGEHHSGVTHLLNAAQNENVSLSIQYLPLKELMSYPQQHILEGLEELDMVCIDDIDCLESNPEWEEGVFYLYNRLRDAGKKILIGGHQPPAQLSLTLPDLQSRLQWGVTVYLSKLVDSDKRDAIKFCAKNVGMQLTDEVANFLLQRTDRSARALFDLIKRLDHASLAEQRKLTIPFVKKIINSL